MSDENQKPLKGQELLDKFAELSHLPRREIVRQCGYFTVTSSGQIRVNFTDCYEEILAARVGISVTEYRLKQEQYFTRPWSTRRGIEEGDRNADLVLARVPIEELSKAIADLAVEWFPNVLGKEIKITQKYLSAFAFQIVGHNWSILTPVRLKQNDIERFSKQFQQPFIELYMSDTCGSIHYQLYDSGELIESFDGFQHKEDLDPETLNAQTEKYELYPYPEDPEAQAQTAYFWSSRRKVTPEEIENIWHFPEQLLREFEAYDPAINSDYFLAGYDRFNAGSNPVTWRVQNPGFSMGFINNESVVTTIPDFVRVDYFIFDRPKINSSNY